MALQDRKRLRTTILEPMSEILVWKVGSATVRLYFAEIVPLMAARILDEDSGNNNQNRNTNASHIERLTSAMESGAWRVTHQGIAFDEDGELVDGQHRLFALIESKTKQVFLVSEGWPSDARSATDEVWRRQLRDHLKIMGVERDRPDLVSAVLNVLNFHVEGTKAKLSFDEARALLAKYEAGVRWAVENAAGSKRGYPSSSIVIAAFVFAYARSPAAVQECYDRLVDGDGIRKGQAIHTLREFLTKNPIRTHEDRNNAFDYVLAAVFQHVNRREWKAVKVNSQAREYFASAYEVA